MGQQNPVNERVGFHSTVPWTPSGSSMEPPQPQIPIHSCCEFSCPRLLYGNSGHLSMASPPHHLHLLLQFPMKFFGREAVPVWLEQSNVPSMLSPRPCAHTGYQTVGDVKCSGTILSKDQLSPLQFKRGQFKLRSNCTPLCPLPGDIQEAGVLHHPRRKALS